MNLLIFHKACKWNSILQPHGREGHKRFDPAVYCHRFVEPACHLRLHVHHWCFYSAGTWLVLLLVSNTTVTLLSNRTALDLCFVHNITSLTLPSSLKKHSHAVCAYQINHLSIFKTFIISIMLLEEVPEPHFLIFCSE